MSPQSKHHLPDSFPLDSSPLHSSRQGSWRQIWQRALWQRALCVSIAATALGGCFYPYDFGPPPGPLVKLRPPPAKHEHIPAPPDELSVWAPGHWHFDGAQFVWIKGRYLKAPRSGLLWRPGAWVYWGDGFVWIPGRWVDPQFVDRARYGPQTEIHYGIYYSPGWGYWPHYPYQHQHHYRRRLRPAPPLR
ncbi:MAG: YXWGXW repeat-containing protein [Deltaproteobacteria bacterium]|nr:YXWGXW repeat-containing protein [Deltaproteobacteria bacterium]